jgi:hypothetical protein
MREGARWASCIALAMLGHAAIAGCDIGTPTAHREARAAPVRQTSLEIEITEAVAAASEKPESLRVRRAISHTARAAARQSAAPRAPGAVDSSGGAVAAGEPAQKPQSGAFVAPPSHAAAVREPVRTRRARLIQMADVCRGVFPQHTSADTGTVTVSLRVANSGRPTALRIVDEHPAEQGFASSARLCVPRLRFEPAADSGGSPIAANSIVRLRFVRGL